MLHKDIQLSTIAEWPSVRNAPNWGKKNAVTQYRENQEVYERRREQRLLMGVLHQ